MTEFSRRTFVGATAAAGAAALVGLPVETASAVTPGSVGLTGTVADIRHVVILMQENRSFDHYFGALNGVRGFDDKQALQFPDGGNVFRQPDAGRSDGGVMLPYRMDTSKYNAQNAGGLPHDWATGHQAINNGAMNKWIPAKGERAMGYFTRADVPYQYALADAFTLCDAYFTSLAGPTDPNRLYLWTGTSGPGVDGTTGPWIDNTPVTDNPVADWTTYAERLQDAGVSWRVYHNPSKDERTGDYDDNALSYFKQFHNFPATDPRYINAMTKWDLTAFDQHCKAGTLPTVSWLVAPYLFSEHPAANPNYGAHWVNTALQSLMANPEVWKHTAYLVMYDENDGYFDHMVPPTPEAGTANEFTQGRAIGFGNRVPCWVASPWSRGGWVNSQVFDHTSVLRLLEVVTGVQEPNISAWRRTVSGDLTSCFDFGNPDLSLPTLPDTAALMAKADAAAKLPAVQLPAVGAQSKPVQEPGARPHRRLPYRPWADVTVDRSTGKVTCALANSGSVAFPYMVYPNIVYAFAGTPYTVPAGASASYVWDTAATDGRYDFTVHGPDGFVRRFAGSVVPAGQDDVAVPVVTAAVTGSSLTLTLTNSGRTPAYFAATPNDFGTPAQSVWVPAQSTRTLNWALDQGRYDVTVTAATGTRFTQRYAGTLH
ncbi:MULTISPECIES: phosphocholine-specific phospholipase C [unclassified Kitasatospora]|uniref:phosphocholine-specific phospholipase C n=1 Tax=unclassified Kitasatospora TaxID=2633591 RepID=UPI00070A857F|nr:MULTISPECIES: phospholipase C, phosphocholine-specific [unclassified Kitasatospora]KQV03328.1 phospholipase C, phosphocholine-specific [Kitasatospora sp. Root107]KRB66088.1 phospholipase C, phosphocholine-specific [Kitasatospora sp. Root187]